MSRDEERFDRLVSLLGKVADAPAFPALEDRAYDAGHLEEEDYARILSAQVPADPATTNLKRHALFCDLCGEQLLRRAMPAADVDYRRIDARRLGIRLGLIALAVFILTPLVAWLIFGREKPGEREQTRDALGITGVRAGPGRDMGREDAPDRLFLRIAGRKSGAPLQVYPFLVAYGRVHLLKRWSDDGKRARIGVEELLPPEGWADPGGSRPRTLLLLLTDAAVPSLQTAGDLETARVQLEHVMEAEGGLEPAQRVLDEVRGTVRGIVIAAPIRD